jgi:hypothetical protein
VDPALLYDENSMFSKIVERDTVKRREHQEGTAAPAVAL